MPFYTSKIRVFEISSIVKSVEKEKLHKMAETEFSLMDWILFYVQKLTKPTAEIGFCPYLLIRSIISNSVSAILWPNNIILTEINGI